jgi:hypothetical protein
MRFSLKRYDMIENIVADRDNVSSATNSMGVLLVKLSLYGVHKQAEWLNG